MNDFFEWKEVKPEYNMTEKQIDLTAFCGDIVLASLLYQGKESGWTSVIDKQEEFLEADNEKDAKSELLERLISDYGDKINDSRSILENLKEFTGKKPKYTEEQIGKAVKHFISMRNGAAAVLDSDFGTHAGESDFVYRNRKLYAEIAIDAIRKVYK